MKCVYASQLIGDSHYIGECFDIGKPFLDYESTTRLQWRGFVSAQLFIDNVLTESILIIYLMGRMPKLYLERFMKAIGMVYILENRDASEERANEYYVF